MHETSTLPEFIAVRLNKLNVRPSWRGLSELSGVPVMTLQNGLKGETDIKLSTARKLSKCLNMSTDELSEGLGWT